MKWLQLAASAAICMTTLAAGAQQKSELMKPPITGLVTMGDIGVIHNEGTGGPPLAEANAHPGVYSGVVLVEQWSKLEPAPGKFDDAQIEVGLKAIREYNAKYPKTPVVGKLRVFGGPNAPGWAKALDGGPITLGKKGYTLIVGKFWTKAYTDAWRGLQAHLAAKYDLDPLIEEVAISSCGSTSAEPFVMSMLTPNIPTFRAAGFSDDQMKACLFGAVDDYAAWKHTAIDYTFNMYRTYGTDTDDFTSRPEVTVAVIDAFRKQYGTRAVVANHGLNDDVSPAQAPVLAEMQKLGPPMEFQTANQRGNFDNEVAAAKKYGATEFEMWNTKDTGSGARVSYDQLKAWTKLFPYTNMLTKQEASK